MNREEGFRETYNPCDECNYSYSKNNQEMGMCKICEFKQLLEEPERKHGRWIKYENEYGEKLHYCSECKNDAHRHYSEYRNDVVELLFDYCQHCGADMKGEEE